MPKTKSHRFFQNGGYQIAQYDDPMELESILLEIGELVGIESPLALDVLHVATYLYNKGIMTKDEFRYMQRNSYSLPLFFLHSHALL